MNKFRREIMWVALVLIIVLMVLSIYGAFIGADRAQVFFNSTPSVVFWAALVLTLLSGLVTFRRLIRMPGLLLMHAGCVLIVIGGAIGSERGYKVTGNDKILKGQMQIFEGQTTNQVFVSENNGSGHDIKKLPFSIKLDDFKIEYYKPRFEYLDYETPQGMKRVNAEIGREVELGPKQGTAKILRKFRNLKISMAGGKTEYYDDPGMQPNPALEVQITKPDGQVTKKIVYSLHPDFSHTPGGPKLVYERPPFTPVSDYKSDLEVVGTDGKVLTKKEIEVNYPLKYGGYRFYQSGYDDKAARYTVLQVVSETGVKTVFAGYWLLCIGALWHMWLRHLFGKIGKAAPQVSLTEKQANGN